MDGDGDGDGDGAAPRRIAPPRMPRVPSGAGRRALPVAIVALALGLLLWFVLSLFQPFAGDGHGRVTVRVPKGAGVGDIGDLLERRGVVSSSFFFQVRARLGGDAGKLKPGSYRLKRDMSYGAALDALTGGPPKDIVNLTIPEGRSRREVARIVGGSLTGSYLQASRRSRLLNPRRYGAKRARDLEGFLFPATYELKRKRPVSLLVAEQLTAFKREFPKVNLRFAKSKNLNAFDVLTIASMIEGEVQVPKERRIVASVIYNRLHAGMPLQIDATVRFAVRNWSRSLRLSELRSPSPYNTYTHRGLPPGPIGSPGLASIQAAAHPARTKYLFYVVKPGGRGEHAFSTTGSQHERDVKRYNRARARSGGRAPNSR
jgi:UPF0755 protein